MKLQHWGPSDWLAARTRRRVALGLTVAFAMLGAGAVVVKRRRP
jgi:hypothetical protein